MKLIKKELPFYVSLFVKAAASAFAGRILSHKWQKNSGRKKIKLVYIIVKIRDNGSIYLTKIK